MNRLLIEEHTAAQEAQRLNRAADRLPAAMAEQLDVPPPVQPDDLIPPGNRGVRPRMGVDAYELARQVYYEQFGSLADCARAIIAAGHALPDDTETRVRERLQTWWKSRRWPKRSARAQFVLRDAAHDGGLYRAERRCKGSATGSGPAPEGKPCEHSPLKDSEYCFHHDPRPEYAERRAEEGRRLAAARLADLVDLEPFSKWLDQRRLQLLVQARAAGALHPNQRGWKLLADDVGVHQSLVKRLVEGKHARHPDGMTKVRATTVVKYLENSGTSFKDIYGFDPPTLSHAQYARCPGCGGEKNHQSQLCRDCHDAQLGPECTYVNGRGVTCNIRSKHESGLCFKHRRIVERVPKPKYVRPTAITPRRWILALSVYRENPNYSYVASLMWAADADGIRSAYKHEKSLRGMLTKQFRQRGIKTAEQAAALHDVLVAEHGPVEWPEPSAGVHDGRLPAEPFRAWLTARLDDVGPNHGRYKQLAERVGMNADNLSTLIRGVGRGSRAEVYASTVEKALAGWGDGTTVADLYGGTSDA